MIFAKLKHAGVFNTKVPIVTKSDIIALFMIYNYF